MGYDVFLMDADNTLFDYDAAESGALTFTFNHFGLPFDERIKARYRQINKGLWALFDEKKVSKDVLAIERFAKLFEDFNIEFDPIAFNHSYIIALGQGAQLINGAYELCKSLFESGKRIYIVTNGIAAVQKSRVQLSLIKPFISDLFVSEDIGYQKPDKKYFDYVMEHIGPAERNKIIVIGDSLGADIRGGINAGLDTCWCNLENKHKTEIEPKYEIKNLAEILAFI